MRQLPATATTAVMEESKSNDSSMAKRDLSTVERVATTIQQHAVTEPTRHNNNSKNAAPIIMRMKSANRREPLDDGCCADDLGYLKEERRKYDRP